ncbi:MAG: hypothetical protein ABI051_01955 [Vicinamibacterales bacterium]
MIGALLLTAAAGCGKSEQQKQTEEAAKKIEAAAETMQKGADKVARGAEQGSDQMAQGLQQMAQGLQQMTQGSAKAVDYELLKALLPEVGGWTRSGAKGEQTTAGPMTLSRTEAVYRKDDSRIELEITDSALSQIVLAPMAMFLGSGYSERSDDGFKRAVKIKGQPAMEEWNVGSKRGEVTALVGGRFLVHASGDDLTGVEPVRAVVENVDFGKLAALK